MKKDRLHDELEEHAPFLNGLRQKEDGFRVPADYFDSLETDVFRQMDALGARPNPAAFGRQRERRSWWQWAQHIWQPRFALAVAGVLAIALIAWWYFPVQPHDDIAVAEISAEDAEAYLMDNLLELDPGQIALALPADELPPISIGPAPSETTSADAKTLQREIQISREDLENLLNDMSEEELEDLL